MHSSNKTIVISTLQFKLDIYKLDIRVYGVKCITHNFMIPDLC